MNKVITLYVFRVSSIYLSLYLNRELYLRIIESDSNIGDSGLLFFLQELNVQYVQYFLTVFFRILHLWLVRK